MRKGSGIAGATLLYGPGQSVPDLLGAMQRLVDDLRADGRRIAGLRYGGSMVRLRADPWEMVLTLAEGPLPVQALGGLVRPPTAPERPDFARVHLARMLRQHRHALGFLLRRRGAPPPDGAPQALAREGQLCLIAILGAAPPAVLVWQPGGLVLAPQELRSADPQLLILPRDAGVPLGLARPERLGLRRPAPVLRVSQAGAGAPALPEPAPPPAIPVSPALPPAGLDRASDRLALALRGGRLRQAGAKRGPARVAALAVGLMWCALLPVLALRLPAVL